MTRLSSDDSVRLALSLIEDDPEVFDYVDTAAHGGDPDGKISQADLEDVVSDNGVYDLVGAGAAARLLLNTGAWKDQDWACTECGGGIRLSTVAKGLVLAFLAGAVVATFVPGGQGVAVVLGTTSSALSVTAEALDDGPCRGERVAAAATLSVLSGGTSAAFEAGGAKTTSAVVSVGTALVPSYSGC